MERQLSVRAKLTWACWEITAGRMKGLAFIKDPDGYWIEIFDADSMSKLLCEQP